MERDVLLCFSQVCIFSIWTETGHVMDPYPDRIKYVERSLGPLKVHTCPPFICASSMGPQTFILERTNYFQITFLVAMIMASLENGRREYVVPNISLSVRVH